MFDFSSFASGSGFFAGPLPWFLGGTVVLLGMAWLLMRGLRDTAPRRDRRASNRVLDAVDTVIGWPPQATRLLTHRHRRSYELLRQAVPEFCVFAQVPVARFVRVPTRMSYAEWLRRVGNACVDLLVCDHGSNIVAVVEVHAAVNMASPHARKRQQRVERVLRAAGIPLLVWEEAHLPSPHQVRRELMPQSDSPPLGASQGLGVAPFPSAARTGALDVTEPPATTWFDELNATRPVGLDDAVLPPPSAVGERPRPVADTYAAR